MIGGRIMHSRSISSVLRLSSGVTAQATRAKGTREDYQRAEQFLPGNLRHRVYIADVAPHWIAKSNRFWYRKLSQKGADFLLVDIPQNTSNPAFDQMRLAAALSHAAHHEYEATQLPFDSF